MAKLEIRNRKSLNEIINSNDEFEIFKNPKTGKTVVAWNGNYAGIDSRLEAIVNEFASTGDVSVLKSLAESSFMCEAREIDANGNPAVTGIDPATGKQKIAEFIPCLLMSGGGQNTIVTKQQLRDALNA